MRGPAITCDLVFSRPRPKAEKEDVNMFVQRIWSEPKGKPKLSRISSLIFGRMVSPALALSGCRMDSWTPQSARFFDGIHYSGLR